MSCPVQWATFASYACKAAPLLRAPWNEWLASGAAGVGCRASPTLSSTCVTCLRSTSYRRAPPQLSTCCREGKTWLTRIPNTEPLLKTDRYERGSYFVFDTSQWECIRKDNFTLHYDALERQPNLPRSGLQRGGEGVAGCFCCDCLVVRLLSVCCRHTACWQRWPDRPDQHEVLAFPCWLHARAQLLALSQMDATVCLW